MLRFKRKTRPVFVLGCQRSGTTICQNIFLHSPDCDVFREGNRRAMTETWRLRDRETIERLIRKSRRRVAMFKPLNDAQWADRFLADYEDSRLIWIYRDPHDTANSAVAKWGESQREMIDEIGRAAIEHGSSAGAAEALRDRPGYAACAEHLSEGALAQVGRWSGLSLDAHSGAAAMWWLRNQLFTSLDLGASPRVLLMRYESLVTDPATETRRMCDHVEIPYTDALVADVHARSVGRSARPILEPSVEAACAELKARLDAALAAGNGAAQYRPA